MPHASADLSLLDDHSVFRGKLALHCDQDDSQRHDYSWPLQVELVRDQKVVHGKLWSVDAYSGPAATFTGQITDDGIAFQTPVADFGNFYAGTQALSISGLHASQGKLVATASARVDSIYQGDISTDCEGQGTLELTPDVEPPKAQLAPDVIASDALMVQFDEPIRSSEVQFSVMGTSSLNIKVTPSDILDDTLAMTFQITPSADWPSGKLTVHIDHAADAGGKQAAALEFDVKVPNYDSATKDPSFELPLAQDSGRWFGCGRDANVQYYDYDTQKQITILPSDGQTLAQCSSGTLRGYIVPPMGATRLHIDAGEVDYAVGGRNGGLTVRMLYDGKTQTLEPDAPIDMNSPPGFSTYSGSIDPSVKYFWLEVAYDFPIYEEDSPAGYSFVDNLRFE